MLKKNLLTRVSLQLMTRKGRKVAAPLFPRKKGRYAVLTVIRRSIWGMPAKIKPLPARDDVR